MTFYKITVSAFSYSTIDDFERESGRKFWDAVTLAISDSFAPERVYGQAVGAFRNNFYFKGDKSPAEYKEIVHKTVSELLNNEQHARSVIVVVKECTAAEYATAAHDDLIGTKTEISLPKSSAYEAGKETVITQEKKESSIPTSKNESAPVSLVKQAERITLLKDGLLKQVHGQRHAVDEMVQSIFECEMFAAHDTKRKGPLATFLFTGPSGVGKTYLATLCGELIGRKTLVVDMSEYSDNLANNKFNGEHGQPAVVTQFARENPDGIIVFDEIEKAHINTIHLFLQILDAARLMDHKIQQEVSFKNNIIIMTTNAGKELYEDVTVCDLSGTPRSVILDGLRSDINPQTREPFFPECIITRMANGHVILFNRLEPYALMQIVRDEIQKQVGIFEKSSGITVEYDPNPLAALMLYNSGGVADARTLRGLAKNVLVRELQEAIMQIYARDSQGVGSLKKVSLSVDMSDETVGSFFVNRDTMYVSVFTDKNIEGLSADSNTSFEVLSTVDQFKKRIRGVTDYILIDPLCGVSEAKRVPNDVEDIDSDGMRMFEYVREFFPEIPIYILNTMPEKNYSFDTLTARGARGVIEYDLSKPEELNNRLEELAFNALINNAVYSLGRSNKYLTFNCAQYIIDSSCVVISFEKLQLKSAPMAGDSNMMARKGANSDITFEKVIGCKKAKETLTEYCSALDDPRKLAVAGKKMPKGVLLYGPPGTGKTLLAKAMANECNASFFPVSATSFFGSLVGETEKNIRDLFKKARMYAPSIIFIDEVDAIARMRTGSVGSVHNEDALNTFLAEMDGFVVDEKRPVFILAATNFELSGDSGRVLDPAFVRRFDNRLLIPLPDTDDRYELLLLSLKKHGIHFGENHEAVVRNMAERTGGMNNADLEMMNTQFARATGDAEPDSTKYMDTLDSFRFGDVNKMDPDHLRQTACHEAGHALVCRLCGNTPSFLTIVSRGNYGGYMEHAGQNRGTYTFGQLMDIVCRCLAGRVAEIEVYGISDGINTGASSDIEKARYFVKASLKDYAMGEKLFSGWSIEDAEKLIQAQYDRTKQMISDHKEILLKLTDLLVEKKSLDKNEMEKFFKENNI